VSREKEFSLFDCIEGRNENAAELPASYARIRENLPYLIAQSRVRKLSADAAASRGKNLFYLIAQEVGYRMGVSVKKVRFHTS